MKTALLVFNCVVFSASVAFWLYRINVRRREGSLLATRQQEASPVGIVDIGAIVFIWLVFQTLAIVPIYFFMGLTPIDLNDTAEMPASRLLELGGWMAQMQLASTFAAILWMILRHRRVRWLGTAAEFPRDLLVGLAGSLLIIPIVILIQIAAIHFLDIPYTHQTLDSMKENFSFRTAVWAWIAAVGVAPITEEFFFRGIVQGWLQRAFDYDEPIDKRFNGGPADSKFSRELKQESNAQTLLRFWTPIVITSLAFAGVHMGQGPAPIPLFFLSLGIGYLFRKTGSFVPCVVVHLVLNSFSMTILTLTIIYPELQSPIEAEPVPAMFW